MKIVRAASRDRLNIAAPAPSECRVVKRGLDLEFLNRLRRGHGQTGRGVCIYSIGVNAVDLEIILSHARAVDRDVL